MTERFSREDILESMLEQSISTIDFLHNCLVNPGRYSYEYPEMTLNWLEEIKPAVPDRTFCFHSRIDPTCSSCQYGIHYRAVMAQWRKERQMDPLEDEDLTFLIEHEADSPNVKITVTHDPTGTTATASGTDEQDVRQAALDDLLGQLENISG